MASDGRVPPFDRRATFFFVAVAVSSAQALLMHLQEPADFAGAFEMWNLMMVGMMLPSLLPWLFLFEEGRLGLFVVG